MESALIRGTMSLEEMVQSIDFIVVLGQWWGKRKKYKERRNENGK